MESQINLEYPGKKEDEIPERISSHSQNPHKLKRIDRDYIVEEIGSVLNFDRGFFYTMRELMLRPGITIREFLVYERSRLVKPVIFIIVTSFIYSVLRQFLGFEDGYIYVDSSERSTSTIMLEWIIDNYGYGNIIMGIFIAFWTKIIFRKYGYNFYEILILLCYVMGIGMLILAIFGTLEGITNLKVLQFGAMVFLLYTVWAIGQFFDKNKFLNYGKALFAYFLGFASFTIAVLVIGKLIDITF